MYMCIYRCIYIYIHMNVIVHIFSYIYIYTLVFVGKLDKRIYSIGITANFLYIREYNSNQE